VTWILSTAFVALLVAACSGASAPGSIAPTRDPDSPYATTREEFLIRVKACVEEKGFKIEIDAAQFGFRGEQGSDERAVQAAKAIKDCGKLVDPKRLEPPPPLSEAQLRAWYAYMVARANCLMEAGYDVGSVPPEQVFIDMAGRWDPFQALIDAETPAGLADVTRCQDAGPHPGFLGW
jgi:hypothetical protein